MTILGDVVYALRHCRQRPALPLIVVFSLGAAMGLSTSLFSVINATWFTPWRVPDAHQLRVIGAPVTVDEWPAWPRQTQAFSGLAAEGGSGVARLGRQLVRPRFVTSNYFRVLRIAMAAGPGFAGGDAAQTTVISHQLWQRRFGGTPDVVGRTLTLTPIERGAPPVRFTIAGVTAEGFGGTDVIGWDQLWLPLAAAPLLDSVATRLSLFGRLVAGVSDDRAEAELSVISRRYSQDPQALPTAVRVFRTDLYSLRPPPVATRLRMASFVLGIAFITLIACANVANLLLARGYARRAEIALRLAIGGRRSLVVRQLLVESLMFSVAAAVVGVAIASWLPDAIFRSVIEDLLQGQLAFPVDRRVFLWSLAVAVVACVAFGLVPALRSTDVTLSDALKEGHDNARQALMPSLLGYQTIVSVMAIVIAGLMLRSTPVIEARRISGSVEALTVVRLDAPPAMAAVERRALVDTLSQRLGAFSGSARAAGMKEDQLFAGARQTLHVTPDYFATVGTPLIAGRAFVAGDPVDEVMVVNEAFARLYWSGAAALGQVLRPDDGRIRDRSLRGRRIVGVVEDAQFSSPTAYLPVEPDDVQVLLVRAPRDGVAREAAAIIARQARRGGPSGPPADGGQSDVTADVMTGSTWVAAFVGPSLLVAEITSGFGGVALVLGIIGFFSLLEYSVQQRTREIGIRRALGAQAGAIVRSLVVPASRPLVRGLLIGSAGAAVLALFMQRAQLPTGIDPLDAVPYIAVAGILAASAVLASFAPARRALRIEPIDALRAE